MQSISNPFRAMQDIYVKPNRVFFTLAQTHNWSWFPFLLIAISTALPLYAYFNFVDFSWYTQIIIQSTMGDLSPAERQMFSNNLHHPQILWVSVLGGIFSVIMANLVLALYLKVTTRADEECVQGFSDWYGFSWWVSMPIVLTNLLSLLIVFFAQDTQLSPNSLSPSSLAFLFNQDMSSPWFTLMQAIRLESIWVMYLIAVGLHQWTKLPIKQTYAIAMAPYLLIWGMWALVLLVS
jgi:hypothetical protein